MLLVLYVSRDRIHRARPVQGYARDYVLEAGRPEVFHEIRHAPALELEHSLGVAVGDQPVYLRIVEAELCPVYFDTVVFFDHAKSVSYDREVAEPQEIHLQKTELLNGGHVELRRHALVGRIKRHVVVERHLRDHYACSMRGRVSRKAFERHRKIEHLLHERLVLVSVPEVRIDFKGFGDGDAELVRYRLCYLVSLGVGRVESSGYVPDRGFRLEGTEGDDLRDLVPAVLVRHVIDDFLASFDAEVDVYIRHAHALRIEEPLEDEAVFYRVDLGYGKAVRHNAACRRAPARADCDPVSLCVVYEVPDYEEVFDIAHAFDDGKFGLEPLTVSAFRIHRLSAIPLHKSLVAKLS